MIHLRPIQFSNFFRFCTGMNTAVTTAAKVSTASATKTTSKAFESGILLEVYASH